MSDHNAIKFVPGVPLYRQVQDQIQEIVRNNRRSRQIPLTDAYLGNRFGVSRITVRKAVEGLVDAGLLYRIPKLGTFISPGKFREKLTLTSFLDPWSKNSGQLKIRIGAFRTIKADREIASRLGVAVGESVIYVQRLRFQKDALVVIDHRYLRVSHARYLTEKDLLTSSFVDFFQNRAKIQIETGEMEIEARGAHPKEAKSFGIKRDQPILARRIVLFGRRGQPLLTGLSLYRADRVSYRVMLSK
jgi:GntR family transcriptional regulator